MGNTTLQKMVTPNAGSMAQKFLNPTLGANGTNDAPAVGTPNSDSPIPMPGAPGAGAIPAIPQASTLPVGGYQYSLTQHKTVETYQSHYEQARSTGLRRHANKNEQKPSVFSSWRARQRERDEALSMNRYGLMLAYSSMFMASLLFGLSPLLFLMPALALFYLSYFAGQEKENQRFLHSLLHPGTDRFGQGSKKKKAESSRGVHPRDYLRSRQKNLAASSSNAVSRTTESTTVQFHQIQYQPVSPSTSTNTPAVSGAASPKL